MRLSGTVPVRVVAAVGTVSCGLMLLELSLTRVFSVTMWYHFAFMAISVAMLGLSAGALVAHRWALRGVRPEPRASGMALACALAVVAGVALTLRLRFSPTLSLGNVSRVVAIYGLTTLPFLLGGSALALVVRSYASGMSVLYFGDLLGAALGCVGAIPLLRLLNGPPVVYVSSCLVALGGAMLGRRVVGGAVLLALVGAWATNHHTKLLSVVWAKEREERGILFDQWNSYSRVTVFPTEEGWSTQFFAWGMSPAYQGAVPAQLGMHIDSYAGTPITAFSGNPQELEHLSYDVTALVYHLRPYGRHLVIGAGGARDVLAAWYAGADSIVAVEMNPLVVRAVNETFGDFSGRPYSLPRVQALITEARVHLRREHRRFTVIQASLVDTWAATAAGAYALTENTLYTVEAMEDYLRHLEPEGLVSISRFLTEPPGEALRLVAVALEALARQGAADPGAHVAVIGCRNVATVLVGKNPLSREDLDHIRALAERLSFRVVCLPGDCRHPVFAQLVSRPRDPEFFRSYVFDVRPTTDDRPFFFNMVKPGDFWKVFRLNDLPTQTHAQDAIFILMVVLFLACAMTVALVVAPLRHVASRGAEGLVYAFYFACLGLGFMLAEVALLQKFALFLGHPVYSLSVVLLSLLLGGSAGSLSTRRVKPGRERASAGRMGLVLAVVLLVLRLGLDVPLTRLLGLAKEARILVAVGLLLPLGALMGTMLPLGMRSASSWQKDSPPWLWGVNGAASVLGSVAAFVLAMTIGFNATLAVAAVAYLAAGALGHWRGRHA